MKRKYHDHFSGKEDGIIGRPFKRIDRMYGFRYGKNKIRRIRMKEIQRQKQKENERRQSGISTVSQGSKQPNSQFVRLTNGISLNLGAEANVDYSILDSVHVIQNR